MMLTPIFSDFVKLELFSGIQTRFINYNPFIGSINHFLISNGEGQIINFRQGDRQEVFQSSTTSR